MRSQSKPRWGQNFLINQNIIRKIIDISDLSQNEKVLEIGPGRGALTGSILKNAGHLYAVETDRCLCKLLTEKFPQENFTLFQEDFMRFDLNKLPKKIKIIANLPYCIASAIIAKIFTHKERFNQIFLMLQTELAQRMIAKAGDKNYSAFSIFCQFHTLGTILFKIKNSSFQPKPKVESCFCRFDPRKNIFPAVRNQEFFLSLVRKSFQQRRKTIINSLKNDHRKDVLEHCLGKIFIDPRQRPQTISLEQYIHLSNMLLPYVHKK